MKNKLLRIRNSNMENFSAHKEEEKKNEVEEPLLLENISVVTTTKGGFRTLPFIIANEGCERLASHGLMPTMILYLMNEYHLSMAAGTNILYFKNSAIFLMPLVGAFLADSLIGRFWCIGLGSIVSLLGMILVWLTALIPKARPPPCDNYNSGCSPATTSQLVLLCSAFGLIAIGSGGIRGSSLAFGADQLIKKQDSSDDDEDGSLESYVNWYFACTASSIVIAFTVVVYITEHLGWKVGFGVPVSLMFLSALSFFLASPFYVKLKAKSSLVTGLAQAIVSSYKNRHMTVPSESTNTLQFYNKGSALAFPSEKLRFLNKACIIKDPQRDLNPDGRASDPWSLCTVDQVEELKSLLKVIPIWSTGVLMSISITQSSFRVLQAKSMDRHITSTFEIPVGSFVMFDIASAILWIILYKRLILRLASRIMGRPVHFTPFQRMGFGIFLSSLAIALSAIVENVRRGIAIQEGHSDDPQAIVNMSAMWLIPQHCLGGVAEALFGNAQKEYYVSEFPKSMSSIATSIGALGMCVATLLASVIMNTIDRVTQIDGNVSWVSGNINKGHYDYYYCVLAGLSFLNLMYFQVCSRACSPVEEGKRIDPSSADGVEDE